MDYQAFLNRLQKRGSKPHTIGHCLGTRDAWKWVRKNKWHRLNNKPLSQSLYSSIINTVNQFIIEQLLEGHEIELPNRLGSLYLASVPAKVVYKDGELKTNYRTDWLKTFSLWFEDEEAYNSHKRIKRVQKDIVFIKYDKHKANFINKRFYFFRANRSLVRKVGHTVENCPIPILSLEDKN